MHETTTHQFLSPTLPFQFRSYSLQFSRVQFILQKDPEKASTASGRSSISRCCRFRALSPHFWVGNDGKWIYFDSIDNSAYILGKPPNSARDSWVNIDGENFLVYGPTSAVIRRNPGCTSLGCTFIRRRTRALGQRLTWVRSADLQPHDGPYEKYDMVFKGAVPMRVLLTSPGRYSGEDNGWALALLEPRYYFASPTV